MPICDRRFAVVQSWIISPIPSLDCFRLDCYPWLDPWKRNVKKSLVRFLFNETFSEVIGCGYYTQRLIDCVRNSAPGPLVALDSAVIWNAEKLYKKSISYQFRVGYNRHEDNECLADIIANDVFVIHMIQSVNMIRTSPDGR